MNDGIAKEIRAFIVSNFLFGQDDGRITEEVSFLESGTIDSTGVLELVGFVEQQYGISIGDRELVPENLDSISNVSRFVARKLEERGVQVAG
jgi:acyl carrier protein